MSRERVVIPLGYAELEFVEGGNTIWLHGLVGEGGTILRIRCTGTIRTKAACQNNVPHADVVVEGDIEICLPEQIDQNGQEASHG